MYHSEEVRRLAPEMDPLRLGMGWKLEDLEKPKVIIIYQTSDVLCFAYKLTNLHRPGLSVSFRKDL